MLMPQTMQFKAFDDLIGTLYDANVLPNGDGSFWTEGERVDQRGQSPLVQ